MEPNLNLNLNPKKIKSSGRSLIFTVIITILILAVIDLLVIFIILKTNLIQDLCPQQNNSGEIGLPTNNLGANPEDITQDSGLNADTASPTTENLGMEQQGNNLEASAPIPTNEDLGGAE